MFSLPERCPDLRNVHKTEFGKDCRFEAEREIVVL